MCGLDLLRLTVRSYFDLYEDPIPDLRVLIAMWGALIPTHASVDGMLEADERGISGWTAYVRLGQSDGSIRKDFDSNAVGSMVMALTRGIVTLHLIDGQLIDLAQVREICDAVIATALAPPHST
jgi:hypothetical protein